MKFAIILIISLSVALLLQEGITSGADSWLVVVSVLAIVLFGIKLLQGLPVNSSNKDGEGKSGQPNDKREEK